MPIPVVDPLPPAPVRSDPNFASVAEVWVQHLADTYTPQLNAFATALVDAAADANYLALSTTSITIGSGVKLFSIPTGKRFAAGTDVKIVSASDPANLFMYGIVLNYDVGDGDLTVLITQLLGSGQTKSDWIIHLSGPPGADSGGAWTNPVITGTITEDVFAITDGASVAINPEDGSIQTWTLGANRTPTITMVAGQSVTLMIADGTAYTVNWSSIAPVWSGGSAPTLPTTGYAVIEVWKVGGVIYMAHVGNVA